MAPSGARPPSTTPSAASNAASDPDAALALSVDLGVRLRPAASIRSMASTGPGGMSRLMVDSPRARGLATIAGTGDGGFLTAGPSPYALGGTATLRPRSAGTSTPSGRIPTGGAPPCQAGPATYSRPSTSTRPRLSARAETHPAASSATPGSARIAARSPRGASADGRPSRRDAAALGRAHPSASGALGSATEATDGTGTSRLRRRKPTAFSTDPLSLPEWGVAAPRLEAAAAPNRENGRDSVTSPRTGRPASVASSGTTTPGARPQRGKTSARPAHGHSARWGLRAAHCPSLGWGSVATRGLGSRASPATTALKLPKSARQAPAGHSSSRQPSPAPAARASRQSPTRRRAVEWDPRGRARRPACRRPAWRCGAACAGRRGRPRAPSRPTPRGPPARASPAGRGPVRRATGPPCPRTSPRCSRWRAACGPSPPSAPRRRPSTACHPWRPGAGSSPPSFPGALAKVSARASLKAGAARLVPRVAAP